MSTKIYDGIRFRSSDLLEIHRQLTAYRPVVAKAVTEAMLRQVAEHAVSEIDRAALTGDAINSPIWNARSKIDERQREIKKTGRRDPRVDFEFTLTIMPYNGAVYGIVFCEQPGWKENMLAAGWAEAFPYWNNTDPPEGVSDEEWAERGDLWNAILAQDEWDRPVGCGFNYDFLPPQRYPDAAAAIPFVPALERRAHERAVEAVLAAEMRRGREAAMAEGTDDVMMIYRVADRALRSPEGKARIEAERDRIAPMLPEITVELLIDGLPQAKQPDPGLQPTEA